MEGNQMVGADKHRFSFYALTMTLCTYYTHFLRAFKLHGELKTTQYTQWHTLLIVSCALDLWIPKKKRRKKNYVATETEKLWDKEQKRNKKKYTQFLCRKTEWRVKKRKMKEEEEGKKIYKFILEPDLHQTSTINWTKHCNIVNLCFSVYFSRSSFSCFVLFIFCLSHSTHSRHVKWKASFFALFSSICFY